MTVFKCDICEAIYPIPVTDTLYSVTIEGQDYKDICDACRKRLKRSVVEWQDQARTKAICDNCGRAY